MPGVLIAGLALTCAAPTGFAVGAAAGHASPGFRVGAAVVRINPTMTTYAGGFGASPPIAAGRIVGPALTVRAMYVANASHAVELAVVDSQAEFAAYQEGSQYGITAARTAAARAIDARHLGPRLSAGDIIVQATHSHSAPTLEGLWGPVPLPYLRAVTAAETTALVRAAHAARPARIEVGTADASSLDDVAVAQYDGFPGWAGDPLLTVLRAVDAHSGATIATYATVPAHPDIVCGSCLARLTADYPGVVRADLHRRLGGVGIVGPGTLGREETPVQATSVADMRLFAREVGGLVYGALTHAHWLTEDTIAAAQRFVRIPGTNAALLGLVAANHLSATQKRAVQSASGEYPLDRADTPPYLTGAVIGTWLTAVRIGDVAYVSMPGEPFSEVRAAITKASRGALVVALSKGQDDLGYFYPSWVTPFTEVYPSDTVTNSASPFTGDVAVDGQVANLRALGFATSTPVAGPVPIDAAQAGRPGVQVIGGPFTADAGSDGKLPVSFLAVYSPPDVPEGTLDYGPPAGGVPVAQVPQGPVSYDFGDGTNATGGYHEFAGTDRSPQVVVHHFGVGVHLVRIHITAADGQVATDTVRVLVLPPLKVSVTKQRAGSNWRYAAHIRGGDGVALDYRWRFADGTTAHGGAVRHPSGGGTVEVTDGTGTSAIVRIPPS